MLSVAPAQTIFVAERGKLVGQITWSEVRTTEEYVNFYCSPQILWPLDTLIIREQIVDQGFATLSLSLFQMKLILEGLAKEI